VWRLTTKIPHPITRIRTLKAGYYFHYLKKKQESVHIQLVFTSINANFTQKLRSNYLSENTHLSSKTPLTVSCKQLKYGITRY